MKKQTARILATALLLSATTAAVADYNGFYAGVGVGGDFTTSTISGSDSALMSVSNASVVIPTTIDGPPFSLYLNSTFTGNNAIQQAQRKNKLAADIFIGYGYACENAYLGLEGYIRGSKYKTTTYNSSAPREVAIATGSSEVGIIIPTPLPGGPALFSDTTLTLSSTTQTKLRPVEFGIDFRPGFVACEDTLVYARVGIAFNRVSTKVCSTAIFNTANAILVGPSLTPQNVFTVNNTLSHKKSRAALRVGGGLEQKLSDCISIRLDYVYTNYGRVTVCGDDPFIVPDKIAAVPAAKFTQHNDRTVKVTSNAVLAALAWYW